MRQKASSKKKQLEQTATSLFQERGYAATSMRDMAQALGIEAASLYSHIKSKEEILQNVCFRMARQFFASQEEALAKAPNDPVEQLSAVIIAHIKVITEDTSASAVFFSEWRHLSEPYHTELQAMRRKYEGVFQKILDKGIANGKIIELNTRFAVFTILSALNWTHNWYKPSGPQTPEQIGRNLADTILNGLRRRSE
jgi:AcrR family transcriptional regulator